MSLEQLLFEKGELTVALEKATEEELWDQVSVLEDDLDALDIKIGDLDVVEVEDIKSFYENAPTVAKSKGLPQPDGRSVKMYRGASVARDSQRPDLNKSKADTEKARTKFPRKPDDYRPDEEELAKIHQYSNLDYKAENLFCYPVKMADQIEDRGYDMMMPKCLQSLAKLFPDKPFQVDHDTSVHNSYGKVYEAAYRNKCLMGKFYVLDQPEYKSINDRIQAGIINKVSVSFAMDPMNYACSSCNKSLYDMACKHYPGQMDEKGQRVLGLIKDAQDAYEFSGVAVPALPAAGIRRQELPAMDSGGGCMSSFDTAKSVDSSVGKIPNEIMGELSVPDVNKSEVVTPADVKPPVTEEPKVPEVEATVITIEASDAVKEFTEIAGKLVTALEDQTKAFNNNTEVLKALVDASNKQSELVSKAMRIPDENPAIDKAKELVTEDAPVQDHDFKKPGGMAAGLVKALCPNYDQ